MASWHSPSHIENTLAAGDQLQKTCFLVVKSLGLYEDREMADIAANPKTKVPARTQAIARVGG